MQISVRDDQPMTDWLAYNFPGVYRAWIDYEKANDEIQKMKKINGKRFKK